MLARVVFTMNEQITKEDVIAAFDELEPNYVELKFSSEKNEEIYNDKYFIFDDFGTIYMSEGFEYETTTGRKAIYKHNSHIEEGRNIFPPPCTRDPNDFPTNSILEIVVHTNRTMDNTNTSSNNDISQHASEAECNVEQIPTIPSMTPEQDILFSCINTNEYTIDLNNAPPDPIENKEQIAEESAQIAESEEEVENTLDNEDKIKKHMLYITFWKVLPGESIIVEEVRRKLIGDGKILRVPYRIENTAKMWKNQLIESSNQSNLGILSSYNANNEIIFTEIILDEIISKPTLSSV